MTRSIALVTTFAAALTGCASTAAHHPPSAAALSGEPARYERVDLPTPARVACDVPRFALLIDHDAGRFWIRQPGGIAGVTRLRGPAVLTADKRSKPRADFSPGLFQARFPHSAQVPAGAPRRS